MPESRSRKKPSYVPPPASSAPKTNPAWLVPTMIGLMVSGLLWVVVTYISQTRYPIPGIENWNLAVGFVLILAGFGLTTRWH
ncbi:cell division protein CrgA [Actinotalea sp.]|uniref:cell division protein CrgA n=1 Tax=Actinotalea sp. TaxID=1872145 RepID=UPI002BEF395F|nr:cell division protein CrgA [Actinotalea sp.]HQY34051.1 cell division protein CrgA [Actinotalea sp.]HRA50349.1 cell division protein CrgA [Actinotalea sp.]